MVLVPRAVRPIVSALLVIGSAASLPAQSQNTVPANYRGPDTYGLCAYVIGDTTYYGRTFYTSSYFKPKAEQEIRAYAQTQAKGSPANAHCYWSYREGDLATLKETDRRLIGLPGHSAKGVDTDWTFHGATVGNGAASASTAQQATNTTRRITPYANQTGAVTNGSGVTNGSAYTSNNTRASSTANTYGSQAATQTTGTANSTAGTVAGSAVAGGMLGGSQQALSDAKNSAVTTAASGMTNMTTNAMGALSGGMQNMFHRKQANNNNGNGQAAAPTANLQPAVATSQPAGGMGMGLTAGDGAQMPAQAGAAASALAIDGVVADVSGSDVIINVGQQAGVQPGTVLAVMHPQRTVNDPVTGKPLRVIEGQVGELRITSVDATSATGTFTGQGVPVVGDKVHNKR